MEIQQDVVIVGGGIAGLATALALNRVGIRSLVLERSNELRATGTALLLAPNAWRALDVLGVSTKLLSLYSPFERGYVTNVTNETVQEVLYAGKDRIGIRALHRSILLEVLAGELPADTIRFSSKLSSIETLKHEHSTLAVLVLDDGTIIKAKVVIGCDGVHSVVGRWLGLKTPIHSGRFAVRGLTVYPHGHGLKNGIHQFVDAVGSRNGLVPLNDKELYWFMTGKSTSKDDEDMIGKPPDILQKRVLKDAASFPPVFLDVVRHSDLSTLTWASLVFRVPWDLLCGNMYKDNITVAGDAMHPMTPDLGQGGCAALEDAVVLGRHIGNSLAQNGRIDSQALKGYVKERRWRAVILISGSYLSGWIQTGGGWFKEFLRDKGFYKFYLLLTSTTVQYDCGELPQVLLSTHESTTKKAD